MALNFPDSPTVGDTYTAAGRTWVWDGTTWNNDPSVDLASVQFDTTAGITAAVGEMAWNAEQETVDLGLDSVVTLQLGLEKLMRVKNASGTTAIPVGTLVEFAGAAGDTVTVQPATTDGSVNHHYMVGITSEEIAADSFGFVTTEGIVEGLNTSAWTAGTILYADPTTAGNLTSTQPAAPNLKMPVAAVVFQGSGTSGKILVRMISGEEVSDLHDVQLTSIADGDVLSWSGANSRWENIGAVVSQTNGTVTTADTASTVVRNITLSTSAPSGGSDGDVWLQYTA